MDSMSFIIATDTRGYWGRSFGADGVTFVMANAYRYSTPELAAAQIAALTASGDTRAYAVKMFPAGRRTRY
jgi:hypothetical protein